jgi:hypothetical protein
MSEPDTIDNDDNWKIQTYKPKKNLKLSNHIIETNPSFELNLNDVYNKQNVEIVKNLVDKKIKCLIVLRGI